MADGITIIDQHTKYGHTRCKHWLFRVWDPRRENRKSRAFEKLSDGHAWAREVRAKFNLGLACAGKLPFALVAEDLVQSLRDRAIKDGRPPGWHVREIELVTTAAAKAGAVDILADDFVKTVRAWVATAPTFAKGREVPLSNVTRNRWLRHLKSVCLHALHNPRQFPGLSANPLHGVKPMTVTARRKPTLKVHELRALVAESVDVRPPCHGPADPMFVAACLEVYGGLRSGEALFARWEWIDWEGEGIELRSTPAYPIKRDKERRAPLLHELRDLLLLRYPGPGTTGYIVESDWLRGLGNKGRWSAFRDYLGRCGVEARNLSPHATRRTWACIMLATGRSLSWVRRALGHSSVKTTDGYVDAEAEYGSVVGGWTSGQMFLRRPAPGTAIEDPIGWLREFLQGGGSLEQLGEASGVPVATLMAWHREGAPEPVRQLFAARHAAATARIGTPPVAAAVAMAAAQG
jgi:integrase